MTVSLDKWIFSKPEKEARVLIDCEGVQEFLSLKERELSFELLKGFLKEEFGNLVKPILFGPFPSKKRMDGFGVVPGVPLKNDWKCTEVNVALELLVHFHPKTKRKEGLVLMGGDVSKYEPCFKFIRSQKGDLEVISFSEKLLNGEMDDIVKRVGKTSSGAPSYKKATNLTKRERLENSFIHHVPDDLRSRLARKNGIKKKTVMYLDHGNVFHGFLNAKQFFPNLKTMTARDVFAALLKKAKARNDLTGANVFLGFPMPTKDMPKELSKEILHKISFLEKEGFEIRLSYNENQFSGGMKEKSVDIEMAVRIILDALGEELEKAIIVSGDADFIPVVRKLKELEKDFEVWTFEGALSAEFIKEIGDYRKILSIEGLLF
jgi:uncharacterized LabA/DUF88 family protein